MWIRHLDHTYRRFKINVSGGTIDQNQVQAWADITPDSVPVELVINDNGEWRVDPSSFPTIRHNAVTYASTATFDNYIETLDPWEIDLLRHVSMDVDPFTVCLEAQTNFRAVSDGSALPTGSASFGWVLSTRQGERLVEGMGPVRGQKVHSFRAEACGVLSFLRFLIRVADYTQMHERWKGVLATDSQSLLDTLFGRDQTDRDETAPVDLDHNRVVLDVLDPEWDVLIEIQQSLKSLPGVHLEYVEGHQDKQTQYHNLDLLAQLNVDADRIAGQYHEFGYPHSPFVIMSPNTQAHLVFDEGTITSRYEEAIRLRATGPSLKEYIRKKHKWKASIMESIDWRSHGQALKRNKQRQTHLVKFIHNILPTTGLQNKFDGGTRSCPLCPCRQEDRDHIFRCPHPTRATWRTNFLDNIQTYCEVTNTYPPLKCLLIFVLRSWLDGTDNPSPDPRQYPSDLYILLRRQQHIGWSQLLQGRFAAEWGVLQTKYHERT